MTFVYFPLHQALSKKHYNVKVKILMLGLKFIPCREPQTLRAKSFLTELPLFRVYTLPLRNLHATSIPVKGLTKVL